MALCSSGAVYNSGPGTDFECFYNSNWKEENIGVKIQDCMNTLTTATILYCLYSSVRRFFSPPLSAARIPRQLR